METTYFCDWYVKADSADKSLLFTFKNVNLEDVRSSQFVIRIYDLMKKTYQLSSSTASSSSILHTTSSTSSSLLYNVDDESASSPVVMKQETNSISTEADISNEELIGKQPIYEYKLDGSLKYFQADTSYVRLQYIIYSNSK